MEFTRKEKNILLDALGTMLWKMENRLSVVQDSKQLKQVRELVKKLEDDRSKEYYGVS